MRTERGTGVVVVLLAWLAAGCNCGGTVVSQITSPAEGAIVRGQPLVIEGTASSTAGAVDRVEVSLDDGATWQPAAGTERWTFALTGADGPRTVLARATNEHEVSDSEPPVVRFTLDNTPPQASVTSAQPDQFLLGTEHLVQGEASDPYGLATVEVSFDSGASWRAAAGTAAWSLSWSPLPADGPHELRARATDLAGNVSPEVVVPVIVDRELPTSALTTPAAGGFLRGATTPIGGTASSTFNTVERVEVSTDDGAGWTAAAGTGAFEFAWSLPQDGAYRLRSRAIDAVGGVEAAPPAVAVIVDNTAPTAQLAQPSGPLAINGSLFRLEGLAADPPAGDGSHSDLASVELSFDDGASWTPVTGLDGWSYDWTLPQDGIYGAQVRATDRAGNQGPASTPRLITVDNTVPTSAPRSPAAGSTVRGATLTLTGDAADALSGVVRVDVSTNGGLAWTPADGTTAWSYQFTPSADGPFDVRARAVDAAGNVQPLGPSHILIVDNTAPACAVASPADGQAISGTTFTVTGSSFDATSGVARVDFSFDDGVTSATAAGTDAWAFELVPPANGVYRLRCRAVDRAGNTGAWSGASAVIVDRSLPSSAIASPGNGAALSASDVTVTGTASVNAPATITRVEVSFDGGTSWVDASLLGSGSSVAFLALWAGAPEGTHALRSRATNSNGTRETSGPVVTIKVDRQPPISAVSSPTTGAALRGASATVAGFAADSLSGVASTELSFDDGASWIPVDSGTTTWSHAWALPSTDGVYSISVRATDRAGNVETPDANVAVVVDHTPPSSAITAPLDGAAVAGASFTVRGNAGDATSGVQRVEVSTDDGATWRAASGATVWSYAWTLPADGVVTVRARAVDRAGNVEPAGPSAVVVVDHTEPTLAIDDPTEDQLLNAASYTVTGTAGDGSGSGIARVELSTNGGAAWTAVTGTSSWSFVWTTPADGPVTLLARAVDGAGNVQQVATTRTVRIDKTAPATTLSSPADGAAVPAAAVTFSGTVVEIGGGLARVECSLDGGASWSAAAVIGSTWSYAWTAPGDGSYGARCRGVDLAGNVEAAPPAITVHVDRQPPVSGLTSPPAGGALRGTSATLGGFASDGTSGVARVELSLDDGASWQPVTSGTTAWSFEWAPLPADAAYRIRVRATDRAGNLEPAAAAVELWVDNGAPASAVTGPADGAVLRGATATISGTATDSGSGIARVELSTDFGATWVTAAGGASWSYAWTLPVDGFYVLSVRAIDRAGNVQAGTSTVAVTVDNTAPSSAFTAPAANQPIGAASFLLTGTASDGGGSGLARVEVSLDDGASWQLATGTTSWSHAWTTPPLDGPVRLRVRATDLAGNVEAASASLPVLIDKTAPTSILGAPADGADVTGGTLLVQGQVIEGGSGVQGVELSTDGGATWASATLAGSNWSYSWTLPADGSYVLRSRATDRAGNVEAPASGHTVKVDNLAPASALTSPADGTLTNLATVPITGTYDDAGGSGVAAVDVSTDDGASWSAATLSGFGAWSFAWSPSGDGDHRLRSRARDRVGLVESPSPARVVTVDRTPPSSAISAPANDTAISTLTQTLSGTAGDGAGSGVSLVEVSTDDGATWSSATGTGPWTFAWTLPADPGQYQVLTRARDAAGNVEAPSAGRSYRALPNVSFLSPTTAAQGTTVVLAGFRFGATQGAITFNGLTAGPALSWSGGEVRQPVPTGATSGDVIVTVNGLSSLPVPLTIATQPPPGSGNVVTGGRWTSLKLGPDGLPRVAHTNSAGTVDRNLYFSAYAGGAWTTTTVDTVGAGGLQHVSLAVDANGVNHLSWNWNNGASSALRYATCASACNLPASWSKVSIVTGSGAGQWTAIAVASDGRPSILFHDRGQTGGCTPTSARCAKYAKCTGTCTAPAGWTVEMIPHPSGGLSNIDVGQYGSLVLDANDEPHAAYQNNPQGDLIYARKSAGVWGTTSAYTSFPQAGLYTSIALENGLPRISHYDDSDQLLYVSSFTGFVWTHAQVGPLRMASDGTPPTLNPGTSIAVGHDGLVRLVYPVQTAANPDVVQLRLAVENGGTWTTTNLGGSGFYGSLALDGLDRARVTQLSGTNLTLYSAP